MVIINCGNGNSDIHTCGELREHITPYINLIESGYYNNIHNDIYMIMLKKHSM